MIVCVCKYVVGEDMVEGCMPLPARPQQYFDPVSLILLTTPPSFHWLVSDHARSISNEFKDRFNCHLTLYHLTQ